MSFPVGLLIGQLRAVAVLSAIRFRPSSAKPAITFRKNRPRACAVLRAYPPYPPGRGYAGPVPGLGLVQDVFGIPKKPVQFQSHHVLNPLSGHQLQQPLSTRPGSQGLARRNPFSPDYLRYFQPSHLAVGRQATAGFILTRPGLQHTVILP